MRTRQLNWLPMICCLFLGIGQYCRAADELSFAEFAKLHAQLVPQTETWKTIPWQTNLLSAQQIAAEKKQPIFIWAMDGHPLGCT
jgi:hypothetical protein